MGDSIYKCKQSATVTAYEAKWVWCHLFKKTLESSPDLKE